MNLRDFTAVLMIITAATIILLSPETENTPLSIQSSGSSVTLTPLKAILFGAVYASTVAFFTYHLGKRGEYPEVLYLLTASLLAVWTINISPTVPTGLLNAANEILSKTSFPMRLSQETALYAYIYMMLLLVTSNFYIAPRHSRELGFLIFGMTFSMPLFREYLEPNGEIIGITAFAVTLALSSSFFFSPNPWVGGIESILISISTVVAFSVRPIAAFIPIALLLTFPRKKRNLPYILISTAGFFLVWREKLWMEPYSGSLPIEGMLLQSALPLLLLLYLVLNKAKWMRVILRNTKGPTPLLLLLTVVYSLGFAFDRTLFPYLLLLLASLSVRIIYQVRNIEKRRTGFKSPA